MPSFNKQIVDIIRINLYNINTSRLIRIHDTLDFISKLLWLFNKQK